MSWWEDAPEIISRDYDQIFGLHDEITRIEVDFITSTVPLALGAPVLDLCCGTGRHAVELAKRGFKVSGLDISQDFLQVARERAHTVGVDVYWINQDVRQIPYNNTFDLVFIMFGAWGYFNTDQENLKVLSEVHNALRNEGYFLLDFFNHDWIIRHFQPFSWRETEAGYYLEKREFDIWTGRHNTHAILIKQNGERKEWITSVRGYTFSEVKGMFYQAGFVVEKIFGGCNGQSFSLESPRLIILAKKTSPSMF